MARAVRLLHPGTGIARTAYFGFSWTGLFFGPLPALFRGDLPAFAWGTVALVALGLAGGLPAVLVNLGWAVAYNRVHATALLEKGYVFDDADPGRVADARRALRIA